MLEQLVKSADVLVENYRPDVKERPGFDNARLARPEFETNLMRTEHRAEMNAELNRTLAGRKSNEWVEILHRGGVPCGPIYAVDEVFADPQIAHCQAAVVNATPEVGQHTDEVLAELGFDATKITALRAKGMA